MKFKVYTIPHTLFAAAHLVDQLNNLGHEAELIGKIDVKNQTMHIIYNTAVVSSLPPNYIVYQTEIGTSQWFGKNYLNQISKAKAVWDYSTRNTFRYYSHNKNISIVTPGVWEQEREEKDIAVTFYGWVNGSHRRKELLSQIGKEIPLNIVTNKMGNDMWNILRRTKVVLNIHFYHNSPLEVFRINEALSFGCQVVSESPVSDDYKGLVHFADGATAMIAALKEAMKRKQDLELSSLDNTEQIRKAIESLQRLSESSPICKAIIRKV